MRLTFAVLVLCFMTIAVRAGAELTTHGTAIHHSGLQIIDNEGVFADWFETRFFLEHEAQTWRFYSDAGFIALLTPLPEAEFDAEAWPAVLPVVLDLARVFIRYFVPTGQLTLGKTYLNYGISGPFNLFDLDPLINPAELSQTKSGLLALAWEGAWDDLSGYQVHLGQPKDQETLGFGAQIKTHLGSFDLGLAGVRRGPNDTPVGIFCQGDLGVGLQASASAILSDRGQTDAVEITGGGDYSFFSGQVFLQMLCFWRSRARAPAGEDLSGGAGLVLNTAFWDQQYGLAHLLVTWDEFFNSGLLALVNCEQGSWLVVPESSWRLGEGLSLQIQALFPHGRSGDQYSRHSLGEAVFLARVQAKF